MYFILHSYLIDETTKEKNEHGSIKYIFPNTWCDFNLYCRLDINLLIYLFFTMRVFITAKLLDYPI